MGGGDLGMREEEFVGIVNIVGSVREEFMYLERDRGSLFRKAFTKGLQDKKLQPSFFKYDSPTRDDDVEEYTCGLVKRLISDDPICVVVNPRRAGMIRKEGAVFTKEFMECAREENCFDFIDEIYSGLFELLAEEKKRRGVIINDFMPIDSIQEKMISSPCLSRGLTIVKEPNPKEMLRAVYLEAERGAYYNLAEVAESLFKKDYS